MQIVVYSNNSISVRDDDGDRIDTKFTFEEIQTMYGVQPIRGGMPEPPKYRTEGDVKLIIWNTGIGGYKQGQRKPTITEQIKETFYLT